MIKYTEDPDLKVFNMDVPMFTIALISFIISKDFLKIFRTVIYGFQVAFALEKD